MDKETLIKKVISVEFNRFLEYYDGKGGRNINLDPENYTRSGRGRREDRKGRDRRGGDNGNFERFFINIGTEDSLDKGGILRFICDSTQIPGGAVGRIDLKGQFSFFEVEGDVSEQLLSGARGLEHEGRRIRIEKTKDEPRGGGRRGGYSGGGRRRSNDGGYRGNREHSGGGRDFGNRRSGGRRPFRTSNK